MTTFTRPASKRVYPLEAQEVGGASIALWVHIFGTVRGWLVTFSGRQARFNNPEARQNELGDIEQKFFSYPLQAQRASDHLLRQAEARRDCYFGVHLFERRGRRLASYAANFVNALWLDEDEGCYPEIGPEPTAVVWSSAKRRQLYWRLTRLVPALEAIELNRRIAVWAGGDTSKAGLTTVLRVPGTSNFKRYPAVDPVVGKITGTQPWDPEVMQQAIPLLPEPKPKPSKPYDGPPGAGIELAAWLEASGVRVRAEVPDEKGRKFAIICPWIEEHSSGDRTGTYVGQYPTGALFFWCWHSHCRHRGWTDFKNKVHPPLGCASRSKARRVWTGAR